MTRTGRFRARVVGPQTGNVLLRKAQHEQSEDSSAAREIARTIVAGKIKNSRRLVVRAARMTEGNGATAALDDAKQRLAGTLRLLEDEATLDGVRGHEGTAAKIYFEVFSHQIRQQKESFGLDGRTRRPPRSRLNAVLSFLYTLLCNDCEAAAEGVGLDPQIGFLHAARPGRPSLGLDLMEELRAPLADRLALTLVNRRQLTPDDFRERDGGAVLLNEDGRETVVVAYQERKQDTITHPVLDQEIEIGLLPHAQARLLARHLRGDLDQYVPYLLR
jgi:CRISPR-associated protein Cas1